MSNEVSNQLLILGNGFDLAAGLKSSYPDFFKYRFIQIFNKLCGQKAIGMDIDIFEFSRKYFESDNGFQIILKKVLQDPDSDITFWDAIFLSQNAGIRSHGSNWYDIESLIRATLIFSLLPLHDHKQSETLPILETITKNFISEVIKNFPNRRSNPDNDISKLQTFLIKELFKFENRFGEYIFKQKENNIYYLMHSNQILSNILDDPQKLQKQNITSKIEVISFNYTTTMQDIHDLGLNFPIFNWHNVHGYFSNQHSGHPIFGIDATDIEENSPLIPFTKTYRVATSSSLSKDQLNLLYNVRNLVFFGHSLSKADYSYFESLFDYYNLYSSDLHLTFYYGTYSKNDTKEKLLTSGKNDYNFEQLGELIDTENNKEMNRATNEVYNLIYHYGKTLNNNHGNNLFHRLLLEGRVQILPYDGARIWNL
ncbi:bacteriophage abortive infection AbiH family protein [Limosilactobacillus agrestis]|uniref:AbiH family protein n=1 Tax=Limosilactobacillus agrestis TaxID=2759748 RepID=UPI001E48C261|nr:AbiH family protein [Limosilactobacillus agrestis]MCD7120326.1 bacteriophage abortive infection AbiH family protein [Limosilactobacillus agrestis]